MSFALNQICGEGMFFEYNLVSGLAALITIAVALAAVTKQHKTMTKIMTVITGIMAAGVFGATDLYTNYICFEVAGFTSLFFIYDNAAQIRLKQRKNKNKQIQDEDGGDDTSDVIEEGPVFVVGSMGDSKSIIASKSESSKEYLGWIVITGMIMAMGMFFMSCFAHTLEFDHMTPQIFTGGWVYAMVFCYYVGFAARAAQVPCHSWLHQYCAQLDGFTGMCASILLLPGGIWSIYMLFPRLFPHNMHWEGFFVLMSIVGVVVAIVKYSNAVTGKCKMSAIYMLIMSLTQLFFVTVNVEYGILLGMLAILIAYFTYGRKIENTEYPEPVFDLRWCSVENLVYKPAFKVGFPVFFGIIFRIIDYLPDTIIAFFRGTVFMDSNQKIWDKVGTPFAYIIGKGLDDITRGLNRTLLKNHPFKHSFINGIAVAKQEARATTGIFMKSVSFGLMLFAIGMIATLVYMAY